MNLPQQPSERRKYPRLDRNLPLKISCDNFDIVTETKNLSSIGAYCEIDKYLQPLTKLKIILLLPLKSKKAVVTKKISCQGVVVRTEAIPLKNDRYNIAIYFNDIQKKSMNIISDYVNSSLLKAKDLEL